MAQQTQTTLKEEVRTSTLDGSAPWSISLTSLMTETWAPPPSSTAISSGLVGSVSGMFPCNDQFQIRNQEYINQRALYKTRHNSFETLHMFCVCSAIHKYTMYIVQQTHETLKQEYRHRMAMPSPCSTAIASGLVESVSWMFPYNDKLQIRSISTRELCKKTEKFIETLHGSRVCPVTHMYTLYMVQQTQTTLK